MSGPGSIFKMFARSPVRPIEQHMRKTYECAEQLNLFIHAIVQQDWTNAEETQQKIVELEHKADELKKDLRTSLSNELFLAIPRSDILELLYRQDRIANKAKDIAGLMLGRKMEIPSSLQTSFINFVKCSVNAAKQANKAIRELHDLVETGFRGKGVNIVTEMIEQLDKLENESDILQRDLRFALFSIEKDLPPINAMFLYKIIEWVGDLADISQQVGNRLQLILSH